MMDVIMCNPFKLFDYQCTLYEFIIGNYSPQRSQSYAEII